MIDIATELFETSAKSCQATIYHFTKNNKWFIGKIYLLTTSNNYPTQTTISAIRQIYDNIEIVNTSLFIAPGSSKISASTIWKYSLIIDTFRLLYISNSVLVNHDLSDLISEHSHLVSDNFEFMYLNGFREPLTLDTQDEEIKKYISAKSGYIEPDTYLIKSSSVPDRVFSRSSEIIEAARIIVFDTLTRNFNVSTKINAVRLHAIRTTVSYLSSPAAKIIKRSVYTAIPKSGDPKNKTMNAENIINPSLYIDPSTYKLSPNKSNNLSIIIPAHGAERYIEECISSIYENSNNLNIEILIGIDNCKKTLAKVQQLLPKYTNLQVFYSESSVGPYILRNSLSEFAKHDNLLFFDADDVMHKLMLTALLSKNDGTSVLRFKYINYKDGSDYLKSSDLYKGFAHGVFFIPRATFNRVGGFQPWTCAADTEFMKRCTFNKISNINLHAFLFYRRIHPNSLTQHVSTNYRSLEREKNAEWIRRNTNWTIPVDRETTKLIQIS
jgi:hypothetical protein